MKKTVYGIIILVAVTLGIITPLAMSIGCSALELSDKEKINSKMLVIAGVGILFMVFSLVLNGIR